MTFNSKEEYIAWRTEWRANYAKLTQQIRDVKFCRWFADSVRGGVAMSEAQLAHYTQIANQHKTQYGFHPNAALKNLRARATAMLEDRKASKVAAQECYIRNGEAVTKT